MTWRNREQAEKRRNDMQRKRVLRPQDTRQKLDQMMERSGRDDELEESFGFARVVDSRERLGWLLNMQPVHGEMREMRDEARA
jgi:hypothetical protein